MLEKNFLKSLSITARLGQRNVTNELKQHNVSGAEYLFLVNLAAQDGISQSRLCEELVLDQALATRSFQSMLKKGFITREKNPLDSREYIHRLTAEGLRLNPLIINAINNWQSTVMEGISCKNQEKLAEQLWLLSQNALAKSSKSRSTKC